jgi:hypothetical protein
MLSISLLIPFFIELHGASLVARKERLQPFLTSLDGEPQDVRLSLDSETESHQSIALCVQVMRCTVSPKCRWKSLRKARGIYITSNLLKEKRYVIIPSSLPGVEDLDTFGRDILLMSAGSLSGKMTRLLDDFLSCYCHHGGPSRLVSSLIHFKSPSNRSSGIFQISLCVLQV